MFTPEELICEGWVQKESRLLLEWRTRWLVLYRDHVSQLPVLCTFKDARCDWDLAAMPEPTERIDLVGCSCGIQADPSLSTNDLTFSLSLRSVKSLTVSKAAPTHVFTVSNQAATFAFATESTHEAQRWVGEISLGIAEAAMAKAAVACQRGGVPCALPQTPTAQTLAEPPTPEHPEVVDAAAAAAGSAQGATVQLEERNAQLEAQVQQLQGALGAMLLGELAAELEDLGAREEELAV